MKERSKERMSELLMEELLAQLGERESLKRKLGDMTGLPVDDLIERLLEDFEQIVETRRLESLEQVKQRKEKQPKHKQDVQTPISLPEQVANPEQVQNEQVAEAVLPSPTSTEQHHTTTEPEGESVLDPVFSRPPQADTPSEETTLLSHTEPAAVEIEEPPSDLPTPSEPQDQTEEEDLFLFQRGFQELAKKVNNEGNESLETELKEEPESVVEERSIDRPGIVDEDIDSLLTP
jgi:hypothetical protein